MEKFNWGMRSVFEEAKAWQLTQGHDATPTQCGLPFDLYCKVFGYIPIDDTSIVYADERSHHW